MYADDFSQGDFNLKFLAVIQFNWSHDDEAMAEEWEISEAARYLRALQAEQAESAAAQRDEFTSIIGPEWTWNEITNVYIAQKAAAAAHLAFVAWLRS